MIRRRRRRTLRPPVILSERDARRQERAWRADRVRWAAGTVAEFIARTIRR